MNAQIIYKDNFLTVSVNPSGLYGNAGKDIYINHDFGMVSDPFKAVEVSVPVALYIAKKLRIPGAIHNTMEKCF